MSGSEGLGLLQPRHVIIVGGGASGVLAALHLLSKATSPIRVSLIEARTEIGRGVAYSTSNPDHLLNVRVANMSAYPDEPSHFWRWLIAHGKADDLGCADPFCFVPRRLFGQYLEDEIGRYSDRSSQTCRLEIIHGTCESICEQSTGVTARLTGGRTLAGDVVVLATGLDPARTLSRIATIDPWDVAAQSHIGVDSPIMVVGTGLTMIDYLLSLVGRGHEGPVYAISRRGLLPQPHRYVMPATLDAIDIPFGASIGILYRWVRDLVREHARAGGEWRGAIDALRPYTQLLWQRMPSASRARFLRHAQPWWSIHRHRMAPQVHTRVRAAIARNQLRIIAGKLIAADARESGLSVTFRRRGATRHESLDAAALVDCQGRSLAGTATPGHLVADLLARGFARTDGLHLGLDVGYDCALIDSKGRPSSRMFAVGPLTRGTFWESIAIPDIARQCDRLGERLAGSQLAA